MIINKPHLAPHKLIIAPRWHDRTVLISKDWVDRAGGSKLIIDFKTKSAQLNEQRCAILKDKAKTYPVGNNGRINCYVVPLEDLEYWESGAEVLETVNQLFN